MDNMDQNDGDAPSKCKEVSSNSSNLDESLKNVVDNVDTGFEINPNNEILNDTLDAFAKTYNLTAQNVKNIIYHVVKNPQTFSTLIDKDNEAISSLRMTRSRLKELERIAQVKLGIELKPVNAARTFLDVNYDDNDEEDIDYRPEETEDNVDAEDNESDFPESNADWGELVDDNWNELGNETESMPVDLLTSVDDPEYLNFLKSVAAPLDDHPLNDDDDFEDDDEFNIIQHEIDFTEEEEFRMDRTTKIPKWELDALREDWLVSDSRTRHKLQSRKRSIEPRSISASSRSSLFDEDESTLSKVICQGLASRDEISDRCSSNGGRNNTDDIVEVFSNIPSSSKEKNQSFYETNLSSSLLEANVQFREEELKTLRIQLEKHVQLLTQCIVGTHGDDKLLNCRNKSLEMIHELDGEMSARAFDSLFHISTLPDAIYSCHDILACQGVELPPNIRASYYLAPKNEVMWVFARCKAFKYPQLVSDVLLQYFDAPHSAFFPSEQILLALALFQLFHVKHSSWNNTNGKYQLIADNFLRTRTVSQIRYHLKNVRASTSKSPINKIILDAQHTGVLNAEFVLDSEGRNAQFGSPIMWPIKFQPEWLKKLASLFSNGQIHVLTAKNPPSELEEEIDDAEGCVIVDGMEQNDVCQVVKGVTDIEILTNLPESNNGGENSGEPEVEIGLEDVSNDMTEFQRITEENIVEADDVDISTVPIDNTKQKSRRKIRVEKCVERLCNLQAREEILRATVEAVNHDLKQRLFMHQDKLKEVQMLILRRDLSIKEIFEHLTTKLVGEQHANTLALIASLVPDAEFSPDSAFYNNSRRLAYRQALEMLVNFYTYLTGCRSSQGVRNAFKNIKEMADSASIEEIGDKLKHHFGSRDDPLWRILRTQISNEKFNERVEDWQYEYIDMDSLQLNKGENMTYSENLKFESVNLPYKYEPTERGHLRLRHGRLTMEHNGRLKTVNVGFTTDRGVHNEDGGSILPTTAAPWTREDDKILLVSFQKYDGDMQKTIDDFLNTAETTNVSALEASRRLAFLIGMMKKVVNVAE